MSAQHSPPPASINMVWVSTLPRSWTGTPRPFQPTARDSASPTPIRSANAPNDVKPNMTHHLYASAFHRHIHRAVSVHLGDALSLGLMRAFTTRINPSREGFSTDPTQSIQPNA